MKIIAVPTRDGQVDSHFGHCDHYTVFHINDDRTLVGTERLESPQGCGCKSGIAATMQQMGITLMLAGNMGQGAHDTLLSHGIEVIRGCSGPVEAVVEAWLNGELRDNAEVCSHHDCGEHHDAAVQAPVFHVVL